MNNSPNDNSQDKRIEKTFAVILGIFALAVIVMMGFVLYACFTAGPPHK